MLIHFHSMGCFSIYLSTLVSPSVRCPAGWEYFEGSCYWLTSHQASWSKAMTLCRDQGADLPKVSSAQENDFLKRNGTYWWLGLKRDETHGSIFKWSDGSLPTYTNWDSYEPNDHNGKEDCACYHTHQTSKWNDFGCGAKSRHVACEKGFCNSLRFLFKFRFLMP